MTLYAIDHWPALFETAETRKLDRLKWFPSPNKLDGLGYRLMIQERDRAELFAVWNVLKSIASRTMPKERRGYLERDGRPLNSVSLCAMSGFPAPLFDRAFAFFSAPEIAWLRAEECRAASATPPTDSDIGSAGRPASVPAPPAEGSTEGKGKEGTERLGSNGSSKPSRPPPLSDEEWIASLARDKTYAHVNVRELHGKMLRWCEVNRKTPTRRRLVNWLNREERPLNSATPRPPARQRPRELPERFRAHLLATCRPDDRERVAAWKTFADLPAGSGLWDEWKREQKESEAV